MLLVRTYTQAKAANQATNNIGPGQHTLYARIEMIHEEVKGLRAVNDHFQSLGFSELPPGLHSGPALAVTIAELQHAAEANTEQHVAILAALAVVESTLATHDSWERTEKYP